MKERSITHFLFQAMSLNLINAIQQMHLESIQKIKLSFKIQPESLVFAIIPEFTKNQRSQYFQIKFNIYNKITYQSCKYLTNYQYIYKSMNQWGYKKYQLRKIQYFFSLYNFSFQNQRGILFLSQLSRFFV
ncbi:hypothetical protein TTHERM_000787424 (macronuclear) [Tetrahymena thermophila SB210]|uniref:Uncharacterized protein n=1 Tax=Tetrahymena thermophila (strain SB210) TaxID=312017 RepID=W7X5Z9_TETTS|nr:hypothetical protein TTHERM_000787424 [Tetrahymena thermophila SB210]EWS72797.1 hypothetical protein TTHERM_000787424 [Tetrahymena thermophila SB210]|eukprot:XP_012654684.1 hypothetical protein TTHERM_000787424 [Tetrahymena thermophila SB210]